MNVKTKSLSRFRKELETTLRDVGCGQAHVIAPPGGEDVVLISRKEYERILDQCQMLRAIADGMSDIAAGRIYTHDEMLSFLEQRRLKWKSGSPRKRAMASQKSKSSSLKIRPGGQKRSLTG